jgi:hypothetical protein
MSYQLSDQAHPLQFLRVDVDDAASVAHPSMQAEAREAANRHNRAIDLLTGGGEFEADWGAPLLDDSGRPVLRDNAAGQFQVHLDSLCIELRTRQTPWTLADRELVVRDLRAIRATDPDHPVVRHAAVLLERCLPAGVRLVDDSLDRLAAALGV